MLNVVEIGSKVKTAVIERPDGSTYEQVYKEFEDLLSLKESLGDDYWIVDIY